MLTLNHSLETVGDTQSPCTGLHSPCRQTCLWEKEPPLVTPAGDRCQESGQSEDTYFLPKLQPGSDAEHTANSSSALEGARATVLGGIDVDFEKLII